MTRFAVVIPLYNKGPHIERALDSVLAQTRPADEIIVVDDNSADEGPSRVAGYGDPRIRLLRRTQPGPGGYAARNLAITETECDWIAFLGADDAWTPDHLAAVEATIATATDRPTEPPLVCVFSGYDNVEPDGRRHLDPYSRHHGRERSEVFDFSGLLKLWLELGDCPIWTSASAFTRASLLAAGMFPADRCVRGGDKDLWLRAAALGRSAACPARTAIYYRDAVNMVTRLRTTNARHCMCDTISGMLRNAGNGTAMLLRRLFNQEVYSYSLYATRGGKVDRAIWSGFYGREDPLKLLVLQVLSMPGVPALARLAKTMLRSLKRAG